MVGQKTYLLPPPDVSQILRYAMMPAQSDAVEALVKECIAELEGKISPAVCYCIKNILVGRGGVDLDGICIRSADLQHRLQGCDRAVLLCATVGLGVDRAVQRYTYTAATKALLCSAMGTERVEILCDTFCADLPNLLGVKKETLTERFSPGYGDLPLSCQADLLRAVQAVRCVGVTLSESMLMSPAKSVTAIVGIRKKA